MDNTKQKNINNLHSLLGLFKVIKSKARPGSNPILNFMWLHIGARKDGKKK